MDGSFSVTTDIGAHPGAKETADRENGSEAHAPRRRRRDNIDDTLARSTG